MAAGLKYDSRRGFRTEPRTNLPAVADTIGRALGDEVTYAARCSVCDSSAGCPSCLYRDVCDRRVSYACVCERCLKGESAFTHLSLRFQEALE